MNEAGSSIKTLGVTTPITASSWSTLDEINPEWGSLHKIVTSSEENYRIGVRFAEAEQEAAEVESIATLTVIIARVKALLRGALRPFRLPNAFRDVESTVLERRTLWASNPISIGGQQFIISPQSSTLDVIDKKYSEVFLEIHSLRQPEDAGEPLPTEYAYWNALKTVAAAYNSLRNGHPRYSFLVQPTAVVDSSGGVRLIWRTDAKQVKANFGGQPSLKSYLYYESGQVYDVETLDAPTLAQRLGWLI